MLTQVLMLALLFLGPAEPPNPYIDEPPAPRIGALGIAGATMAAASCGVLVTGVVHLAIGPFDPRFEDGFRHTRASTRALVGLGAAGVVAGFTSLAFDLALRARARRRVSVHADLTPTSGGVWLVGRF